MRAKLTDMEDWRRFRSVASEEVRGELMGDGQSSSKGVVVQFRNGFIGRTTELW